MVALEDGKGEIVLGTETGAASWASGELLCPGSGFEFVLSLVLSASETEEKLLAARPKSASESAMDSVLSVVS
jgi:hypothetical protein